MEVIAASPKGREMTTEATESDCTKCEARIKSEVVERIESLMISCYGGNKLLLAKDLKALKKEGRDEQNANKEI